MLANIVYLPTDKCLSGYYASIIRIYDLLIYITVNHVYISDIFGRVNSVKF